MRIIAYLLYNLPIAIWKSIIQSKISIKFLYEINSNIKVEIFLYNNRYIYIEIKIV